jgi:puromycin-sensitive aminopeptidase
MIPVSITTSKYKDKTISTVLKTKEAEVVLPDVAPDDWIKVNPGTVGFYRTQYPPEMLEKLIPAIKDRSLPPLDRLGLLDDLFAMVQAGHTNTVEVLKLLQAYEDETDYTVWSSISNVLVKLNMLLSYTDCAELFKGVGIRTRTLQPVTNRYLCCSSRKKS